ncbi:MAG: hypothetical protein DIU79_05605, partial [Actinobacteria bacterium]
NTSTSATATRSPRPPCRRRPTCWSGAWSATRWAQDNLVLVGDSAHGLHAMGGQGLNTSLQDAVCTAVALDKKLRSGDDSALRDFHAVRRPFIEAFQDQQRRRASGQHDLPLLDLDTLALGQPELRDELNAAAAVFAPAAAR